MNLKTARFVLVMTVAVFSAGLSWSIEEAKDSQNAQIPAPNAKDTVYMEIIPGMIPAPVISLVSRSAESAVWSIKVPKTNASVWENFLSKAEIPVTIQEDEKNVSFLYKTDVNKSFFANGNYENSLTVQEAAQLAQARIARRYSQAGAKVYAVALLGYKDIGGCATNDKAYAYIIFCERPLSKVEFTEISKSISGIKQPGPTAVAAQPEGKQ